jgi:hypothetical protein
MGTSLPRIRTATRINGSSRTAGGIIGRQTAHTRLISRLVRWLTYFRTIIPASLNR